MEIKYLEVLEMPNGEILSCGISLGRQRDFEKYLSTGEEIAKRNLKK
jgi:hypothetical protein